MKVKYGLSQFYIKLDSTIFGNMALFIYYNKRKNDMLNLNSLNYLFIIYNELVTYNSLIYVRYLFIRL